VIFRVVSLPLDFSRMRFPKTDGRILADLSPTLTDPLPYFPGFFSHQWAGPRTHGRRQGDFARAGGRNLSPRFPASLHANLFIELYLPRSPRRLLSCRWASSSVGSCGPLTADVYPLKPSCVQLLRPPPLSRSLSGLPRCGSSDFSAPARYIAGCA